MPSPAARIRRDPEAVEVGQPQVEDDGVGGIVVLTLERREPGADRVDRVPLDAQRPFERVEHRRVVVDDENAHRPSLAREPEGLVNLQSPGRLGHGCYELWFWD